MGAYHFLHSVRSYILYRRKSGEPTNIRFKKQMFANQGLHTAYTKPSPSKYCVVSFVGLSVAEVCGWVVHKYLHPPPKIRGGQGVAWDIPALSVIKA
jgi:hypothetical protein